MQAKVERRGINQGAGQSFKALLLGQERKARPPLALLHEAPIMDERRACKKASIVRSCSSSELLKPVQCADLICAPGDWTSGRLYD